MELRRSALNAYALVLVNYALAVTSQSLLTQEKNDWSSRRFQKAKDKEPQTVFLGQT